MSLFDWIEERGRRHGDSMAKNGNHHLIDRNFLMKKGPFLGDAHLKWEGFFEVLIESLLIIFKLEVDCFVINKKRCFYLQLYHFQAVF